MSVTGLAFASLAPDTGRKLAVALGHILEIGLILGIAALLLIVVALASNYRCELWDALHEALGYSGNLPASKWGTCSLTIRKGRQKTWTNFVYAVVDDDSIFVKAPFWYGGRKPLRIRQEDIETTSHPVLLLRMYTDVKTKNGFLLRFGSRLPLKRYNSTRETV